MTRKLPLLIDFISMLCPDGLSVKWFYFFLSVFQVLDGLLAQYGTVENCEQGRTAKEAAFRMFSAPAVWRGEEEDGHAVSLCQQKPQLQMSGGPSLVAGAFFNCSPLLEGESRGGFGERTGVSPHRGRAGVVPTVPPASPGDRAGTLCFLGGSQPEALALPFELSVFLAVNTDSETAVVNVTYANREQTRQ